MALSKSSIAECVNYCQGRSCWTKLFSRDLADRKRLQSIERALEAIQTQLQKIKAFAGETENSTLQNLLDEKFELEKG